MVWACRRKTRLSQSFQRGSVWGKCMPMSPMAAAPRMASVMACARTSASEWPSSPNSLGMVTPPRISGRPATSRCTSQPWPERYSLKGGFPPEEQVRQFHVAWLGDLDVAVATHHDAHIHVEALHQAGFVGAHKAVLAGRFEGALEQVVTENLGCLRQHQLVAREGGANVHAAGAAAHLFHRIDGRQTHDGSAGFGGFVDDLPKGD